MDKMPKIANAEWRVMKILWKDAPLTAKEIIEKLSKSVTWSPQTIKTLLNRLVEKKALGFQKQGKTYLYEPLLSEKECSRVERKSFLSKVYNGALQPLLAAFLEDAELTQDQINELKGILDKKGEK